MAWDRESIFVVVPIVLEIPARQVRKNPTLEEFKTTRQLCSVGQSWRAIHGYEAIRRVACLHRFDPRTHLSNVPVHSGPGRPSIPSADVGGRQVSHNCPQVLINLGARGRKLHKEDPKYAGDTIADPHRSGSACPLEAIKKLVGFSQKVGAILFDASNQEAYLRCQFSIHQSVTSESAG